MSFADDTVRSAAAGVSAHLVWQVAARIASFMIRAVVVRALGPAQYAFVEIRLTILITLSLLPAVQAFRKVALRAPNDQIAATVCYVCVVTTVLVAWAFGYIAISLDPDHALALQIATLASVIRAFGEPGVVFSRRRERYAQSSRARAVSTVLSSLAQTVAVSLVTDPKLMAPASAVGHLSYVISLGIAMFYATGADRIPWLTVSEFWEALRRDDLIMVGLATGEGLVKFLLENGEGIILDLTCSSAVTGAYKLAGNIASILARFFSEALEEQSFNVFNRLAPAFRSSTATDTDSTEREKDMRATCVSTLVLALKAAITVSILFALIGPAYSYALLRLLYGEKWADHTPAAVLLNKYFVYLVFMAGNGVSEAFVSASASTSELKKKTKFTTMLSVAYMTSLYFAAKKYGATGIIAVNCMNMAMRTCYSAWFFQKLTGERLNTLRHVLPHRGVIAVLLVAQRISIISEKYFLGSTATRIPILGNAEMFTRIFLHGISGVLAVVMFAVSLRVFERSFIGKLRSLRAHQD